MAKYILVSLKTAFDRVNGKVLQFSLPLFDEVFSPF